MLLKGRRGYVYVGYRQVLTFEWWDLTGKVESLGSKVGRGSGKITSKNEAWVGEPPTKIEFWIGAQTWTWYNVRAQVVGPKVLFTVEGDPEVR